MMRELISLIPTLSFERIAQSRHDEYQRIALPRHRLPGDESSDLVGSLSKPQSHEI
jgi:hypothetical protein